MIRDIILAAANAAGTPPVPPSPVWQDGSLAPYAYPWYGAAAGNGVAVITAGYNVNAYQLGLRSTDAITWSSVTMAANVAWGRVRFLNNLFVAVAGAPQTLGILGTSPDGTTWTQRNLGTTDDWVDVAYGNGTFVAIAGNTSTTGNTATSPNGTTWTGQYSVLSGLLQAKCMAFGNGLFVALNQATNCVATSPDGVTWTSYASAAIQTILPNDMVFAGGQFVAVGRGGIATSPNGTTWTNRPQGVIGGNAGWQAICWGDGRYVVVAHAVGGIVYSTSSTDGINWTQNTEVMPQVSGPSAAYYGIGYLPAQQRFFTALQSTYDLNYAPAQVLVGSTTWNPADKSANIVLSNGNLTAAPSAGGSVSVRSIFSTTTGKHYWEMTVGGSGGGQIDSWGIATAAASLTAYDFNNTATWYQSGLYTGSTTPVYSGMTTPLTNEIIAVAVDMAAQTIWWRSASANGDWNNNASADPGAGTGGYSLTAMNPSNQPLFAYWTAGSGGDSVTANFGGSKFTGTVPTGFQGGFG